MLSFRFLFFFASIVSISVLLLNGAPVLRTSNKPMRKVSFGRSKNSTDEGALLQGRYIISLRKNTSYKAFTKKLGEYLEQENALESPYAPFLNSIESAVKFNRKAKFLAVQITDRVAESIREFDEIATIEPEGIVYAESVVQGNAPWGLVEISKAMRATHNSNSSSTTKYDSNSSSSSNNNSSSTISGNSTSEGTDYIYPDLAGENVTVYVIDSGIKIDHPEFENRAVFGFNAVPNTSDDDSLGHGTHVAGIIGSKTFGVAKKCKLVAVKIFSDTPRGFVSSLLSGIAWAIKEIKSKPDEPAVINLSVGCGKSMALEKLLAEAAREEINIVVAAGNSNQDACKNQLAAAQNVVAVGATDIKNERADFSNYGSCVKIFAPGVDIPSTWTDDGAVQASGTSMAAPHVAGAAAVFLSYYDYLRIFDYLEYLSNKDTVANSLSDANRLLSLYTVTYITDRDSKHEE